MGTVFKALDMRRVEAKDRTPHVAVKVLNENFKQHPDSLIALQRETRKAQDLAHPNIVTTFDFDRDGDTVYMTMELLEGTPLDQFLRDQSGSGVDLVQALRIIEGMSNALAYAHGKSIVHSDFKPGNCYVTEAGNVKVLDFGIARAASRKFGADEHVTIFDPATLAGITPAYATAEQINAQVPDELDDIYALSCIAYELLTGRHPYDRLDGARAKLRSLTPTPIKGVPSRINRAILRGLDLDRTKRTETILQFQKDMQPSFLERWLASFQH